MENDYEPNPVADGEVQLSPELLLLVELLAENAHDIWARQRLEDGWTYGPTRCDINKQHPCLVPYASLPEAEKAYDRNAVVGTVRAIIALGFSISR